MSRLRIPSRGEKDKKILEDLLFNFIHQQQNVPEPLEMPADATESEQMLAAKLNELLELLRSG